MKKTITTDIIFVPSQKLVYTNIDNFDLRNLYAIINQSTQTIIYATGIQGKGGTMVSENVIELSYDTTSMSASDRLQIIYDDSTDLELLNAIYEGIDALGFLTGVRGPAANLRVTVTDGAIAVSSGTITTVGNIGAVGGYSANPQVPSTINIGAIQSNINNIQINIS